MNKNTTISHVIAQDLADYRKIHEASQKFAARKRDIAHSINNGFSSFGTLLFKNGIDIDNFISDLSSFNAIANIVFTYFPELYGVISEKDINSYIGNSHFNFDNVDKEIADKIAPLIDKLVDVRYNILKKKYGHISEFPDKHTLCGIFANENYLESVVMNYDRAKNRCSINNDLFNFGKDIAYSNNPDALNYFYSNLLKCYLAEFYGEKAKLPFDRLKVLFPNNNLFSTLFNDVYMASCHYPEFYEFGKLLIKANYTRSFMGKLSVVAKIEAENSKRKANGTALLTDEELMEYYRIFKKSFTKLKDDDFITFEQFKAMVFDKNCFNAVISGFEGNKKFYDSPSFRLFGERLAEYNKEVTKNNGNGEETCRRVIERIIDIFKLPSKSEQEKQFNNIMEEYPKLNGTLKYIDVCNLFRPGEFFDVVETGYSIQRSYSSNVPTSKRYGSR